MLRVKVPALPEEPISREAVPGDGESLSNQFDGLFDLLSLGASVMRFVASSTECRNSSNF